MCEKKRSFASCRFVGFFLLSFAFYVLCRAYSSIAFGLAEGWNETAIGVELDFAELFAYVHLNTMKCSPFGVNK